MWKFYLSLAAAVSFAAGGAMADHYVMAQQEEKRVENCAVGITSQDLSKCPQRIVDAFSTLTVQSAEKSIEYRDRYIAIQGEGRAAAAARDEQLQADLASIAGAPPTTSCATAPAMVELRSQICKELGGC